MPARKKQSSDAPASTPRGRKKAATAAVAGAETPARQTRKAPSGGGGFVAAGRKRGPGFGRLLLACGHWRLLVAVVLRR